MWTARGLTSDQVGEKLGVGGSTIRNWRQDPEFQSVVHTFRSAALEEAANALAAGARKAVAVLLREMDGERASDRIRAALGFLGQIPPLSDHAVLEARIAALEAQAEVSG